VTLTLVAEEPEDNSWQDEEIHWEAGILFDLGYVETKEEWLDFQDHMVEHAIAWMQTTHDEKYHGE
jgi:hypothetical protein